MSFSKSFKPIIDKNSKILILGSMPGRESLEKNQYYAYKRNHFWKIIFDIFNVKLSENEEYINKKALLIKKNIALWDVIESCFREGSLDSNIKKASENDFENFFKMYPNIKHIFFNGNKSHDVFKTKVGFKFDNIGFHQLPSTSPAFAKIKYDEKLLKWKIILDFL